MLEAAPQHHPYSASGSYRWLNCPGSIVMQKGMEDTSSSDAQEGSAAHFLASECLLNGKSPFSYLGSSIICWESQGGKSGQSFYGGKIPNGATVGSIWKVDDVMAEHISGYCDYVREAANGGTLLAEQKVDFGSSIGCPGAFGTGDALILSGDGTEQIVVDLKYGRVPVYAENNPQLSLYALGALSPLTEALLVRLVIFQPRLSKEPDEWVCDLETLMKFSGKAKRAIGECEQAEKQYLGLQSQQQAIEWAKKFLNPSEKTCTWCRAKSTCPAIAKKCLQGVLVTQDANTDGLEDLDAPANSICVAPDDLGVRKAIANVATLDFRMVEKVYANRKLFADWLKAVEGRMLKDMLNGAQSEEWKLVKGRRGDREWSDEDEVAVVMKKSKLKVVDIYNRKLISVTQAEKMLKKTPDTWEKLQPLITRSEGGLTVAPIKDKRQAVNMKEEALTGFECLDEPVPINDLI